ncbi:MAG: hypothetical protein Q8O86_11370 [Dehalococcoidia bacterium]|nr:hypothetical protein [Dehalococcoidia bacterium]
MATTEKRVRVTLDLGDPDLYKAIRHAAIERNQPVRAIVVEALQKWLEEQEAKEDLQDCIAAEEARRDAEPIVDWDEYAASRDRRKSSV